MLDLPRGRLTADDLRDASGLMARGWVVARSDVQIRVRDPQALAARGIQLPTDVEEPGVVALEFNPTRDPAQPYLRAKFRNGTLESVSVQSDGPLTFTAQGRAYSMPVKRTRVAQLWGAPLQMYRFNAINGKLPD